jgi:hypothetical protein
VLAKFDGGKLDESAELRSVIFDCNPADGAELEELANAGLERSLAKVPGLL